MTYYSIITTRCVILSITRENFSSLNFHIDLLKTRKKEKYPNGGADSGRPATTLESVYHQSSLRVATNLKILL